MKKAKIQVHKKGNKYIVTDVSSNVRLYSERYVPVYNVFEFGKAFQTGVASLVNVPGNYYSFHTYLSMSDDKALESDWRNVGLDLLGALHSVK